MSYEYITCPLCNQEWRLIDFGGTIHKITCNVDDALKLAKRERERDTLWKFVKALRDAVDALDDVGPREIETLLLDHQLAQAIDDEPWIILNCDMGGWYDGTQDR